MAEGWLAPIGRWCFTHRWSVLLAWVVVLAAGGEGVLDEVGADRLEAAGGGGGAEALELASLAAGRHRRGDLGRG